VILDRLSPLRRLVRGGRLGGLALLLGISATVGGCYYVVPAPPPYGAPAPPPAGAVLVPGQWVWTGAAWVWRPPYWASPAPQPPPGAAPPLVPQPPPGSPPPAPKS
jgi:hypothetical protein